jgi:hypothetical protein
MTKRATLFILILLLFASCKPKREDLIARKWQGTAISNPQMEEVISSQQAFIDTVGSHTGAAEDLREYGVSNMDSFKQLLQMNLDSFRAMQQRLVASKQFDFQRNGIVYIHTEDRLDSANWAFEEDGILLLDEQKLKGTGGQLRIEVVTLNDTLLKLKFRENNATSTAVFKPLKK